ncbi:thioredoxin family protein [Chengkuizengella axinellae]|uniref:Thioredoxin family protein n=1 Tax=Chengkuizengella axinellae TaxID=3064388 RepID=A0ABT9ITC3_9BACL|nr:thioredoxin family protein [Chengkuizengella sp. 2205SS18-9]MDP5272563.1 thioredoxin family protein [Chengkuizengella sp. 2205SS18-9]
MEKITSQKQFSEFISREEPTIAVFKADWCVDCRFIDPFMPEVVSKYGGKVHFIEIDSEQFPDLVDQYNVLGIPSFIAFHNQKELIRFVNKLRKTREEIEAFADRAIEVAGAMQKS